MDRIIELFADLKKIKTHLERAQNSKLLKKKTIENKIKEVNIIKAEFENLANGSQFSCFSPKIILRNCWAIKFHLLKINKLRSTKNDRF